MIESINIIYGISLAIVFIVITDYQDSLYDRNWVYKLKKRWRR